MNVTIYHNAHCSTSRKTLALIRAAGFEPTLVDDLKHPPDLAALKALLSQLQFSPRQLLRDKEPLFTELHLEDPALDDERLISALLAHPRLMNRPIVITAKGARLCRPAETVHELLQKVSP